MAITQAKIGPLDEEAGHAPSVRRLWRRRPAASRRGTARTAAPGCSRCSALDDQPVAGPQPVGDQPFVADRAGGAQLRSWALPWASTTRPSAGRAWSRVTPCCGASSRWRRRPRRSSRRTYMPGSSTPSGLGNTARRVTAPVVWIDGDVGELQLARQRIVRAVLQLQPHLGAGRRRRRSAGRRRCRAAAHHLGGRLGDVDIDRVQPLDGARAPRPGRR